MRPAWLCKNALLLPSAARCEEKSSPRGAPATLPDGPAPGGSALPGPDVPPDVETRDLFNHYWKAAPLSRKAIWIGAGGIGLAVSLLVVHHLGYVVR